ncbi:asparagine synthase (glutamine-hydrolysing) [Rhodanobacter glycinis]|uniref:asparagine synthase (glutamine-hydrolyzing) n=2 Tax=Rhodanobacter glycinis TaxID=582702 RepID=A0A1I4A041_9GAMM|nr:asparagine synthase (glutamine-hydrolysing) [Rhodanobacter glycinis]
MRDRDSDWLITYNGEIFNYLELRRELISLGRVFESDSDTEVLLQAWAQWGVEALSRLNGMFAFAVFNKRTGELWLVRDRYGVKPLLWGRLPNGGLVFSSSVASVATDVGAEIDLDYCARGARYKAFELPESGAPFRQVHAVPPGCWVKVQISDAGLDVTEGQWYDLRHAVVKRAATLTSCTDQQLLEECRLVLESAVQLRLRSDVPLAVSLSGGLDSSSIAALASRRVADLKGFTYGAPDAAESEGPVVADFAKRVGIGAEFIWPKFDANELDALLERTFVSQEAPFGGLSVLAQNEVFRTVHQAGFKVLLGGQGGDESFAGYRKFFVVALRDALSRHDPRGAVHFAWSLGLMLLHEARQARMYWQGLSRYSNRRPFEFQLLDWQSPAINLWGDGGTALSVRQIEDVQRWSIPSLLRYEDRNSMSHGLETRLPFMDYRLVELALALPARLKIAKGFGKWALRSIDKGTVPDFIRLNRRKRGFDVTQSWIEGGIGASLRRRIQDHRGALAAHLKPKLDIDRHLTNERLSNDRNLLDEALMLAWLAEPVRAPNRLEPAA